jgi:carboxyl-terminal processing protease
MGRKKQIYKDELTILVSDQTASAAEILAGALQHYHRAKIIGQTTYGKGSFQRPIKSVLDRYNVQLRKTQGLYYFPDNITPQIKGITPDILTQESSSDLKEKDFLYPFENKDLQP